MVQEALRVARARHVTRLVIHYLRRNLPMTALARSLGDIEEDYDGDDVIATLPLVRADASYRVTRRKAGPLEVFETMPAAPRGHVLFVHGAGGDAWQWRQWVQPAVAGAGYRTTAVNLHNHGASARLADADAESYLADVEHVMRDGPHEPIVVGHSMGGYIAQRFAERHAVEHLVLVGSLPPTRLPPERLVAVRDGLRTRHGRDVLERTMVSARPVATELVRCRVTVVGGTHDKVVPMSLVRDTALAYGVTAHELPNSGHSAMLGADWRQLARLCVK
jgi:pimeloyl-ACP methyl ester carboxylesterase